MRGMFDFEGFGQRLLKLRKSHGMTQDDMAGRLGITAQAVSKWENGSSYPDITLLPAIAAILQIDIDGLFGVVRERGVREHVRPAFPEEYEGLPLVHEHVDVACYSDKEVKSINGSGVAFVDGSTAELTSRLVTNMGRGDIKTLKVDRYEDGYASVDYSKTSAEYEFGATTSINASLRSYKLTLSSSADGRTRVRAEGHPVFINFFKVEEANGALRLSVKSNDDMNGMDLGENNVSVELPYSKGESAKFSVDGSGELDCGEICFGDLSLGVNGSGQAKANDAGAATININGSGQVNMGACGSSEIGVNGSGVIRLSDAGEMTASVNGSGDITADSAASLDVGVNGAADVSVGRLRGGNATMNVRGAADVDLGGECDKFEVRVSGSGELRAAELTARVAHIVLDDRAQVVLGRVTESSTEQVKKKGRITILNRGV